MTTSSHITTSTLYDWHDCWTENRAIQVQAAMKYICGPRCTVNRRRLRIRWRVEIWVLR